METALFFPNKASSVPAAKTSLRLPESKNTRLNLSLGPWGSVGGYVSQTFILPHLTPNLSNVPPPFTNNKTSVGV